MENRLEKGGDGGMYEAREQRGDGHTIIYRADNETDFIRHIVEDRIGNLAVVSDVKDVGDGWTRVQIQCMPNLDLEVWRDLSVDFDVAFTGKDWYDCKETDWNQDGTQYWWVVKHKGGPWI